MKFRIIGTIVVVVVLFVIVAVVNKPHSDSVPSQPDQNSSSEQFKL